MDALALVVAGFRISGTFLLGAGIVVLVMIGLIWFVLARQRR